MISVRSVPSLAGSRQAVEQLAHGRVLVPARLPGHRLERQARLEEVRRPGQHRRVAVRRREALVSFTCVRIDAPGSSNSGSTGGLSVAARISQPPLSGAVG